MTLINCQSCDHEIAKTADTCPKCGAKNTWLHPEIKRFIDDDNVPETDEEYQYRYNQTTLVGYVLKRGHVGWAGKLSSIAGILLAVAAVFAVFMNSRSPYFSLAVYLPMLIAMALIVVAVIASSISMLRGHDLTESMNKHEFKIDFSQEPPVWKSDDDEFWQPVKGYFKIKDSRAA